MKTSDSDLKVNRNIYPDAVTCDRMRLIGPKCDQLGPIDIVYLKNLFTLMSVGREKLYKYVKRMLPLFRAVVKFCSTNRL